MKRYAWLAFWLVVVAWLVQDPGSAARITRELGTIFGHVLADISRFLSGL